EVILNLTTIKPKNSTCQAATDTVTIKVLSNATISTPTNINPPTFCINTALDPIEFTIGGAGTGATATGLPAGVTGSFSNGKYTLTGTPTASGTFSNTITSTGNCNDQTTRTGTITVSALPTISGTLEV